MTLVVDISKDLETMLEAEAKRAGLSKDEFVREALREKISVGKNGENGNPATAGRITAIGLPVTDRMREYDWLKQHRREFAGQYVALLGSELIAADKNAKTVFREARARGAHNALVIYVEEQNGLRSINGGLW